MYTKRDVRIMCESENILKTRPFKCSVSSVLNKDVKQHGKAFMFDGLDDTAWYSDQGLPQSIVILFKDAIDAISTSQCRLGIKFQGGFVGNVMHLSIEDSAGTTVYKKTFYPDDVNNKQIFSLADEPSSNQILEKVRKITIAFEKSSDFFGRIIIYDLEICTSD